MQESEASDSWQSRWFLRQVWIEKFHTMIEWNTLPFSLTSWSCWTDYCFSYFVFCFMHFYISYICLAPPTSKRRWKWEERIPEIWYHVLEVECRSAIRNSFPQSHKGEVRGFQRCQIIISRMGFVNQTHQSYV